MRRLLLLCVSLLIVVPVDAVPRIAAASMPAGDTLQPVDSGTDSEEQNQSAKKKKKQAKKKAAKRKAARKARRQKQARKIAAKKTTAKKQPTGKTSRNGNGDSEGKTSETRRKPKPSEKGDGIRVKVLTWKQTTELVAKQKGKVVVVDIWSSWCEPCVKEFPKLVQLQKDYPKSVVCVSFNVDNDGTKDGAPAAIRGKILKFLKKREAKLVNVISKDPDEDVYKQVAPEGIPVILVFGKDGKLAKKFDVNSIGGKTELSYEKHVIPFVKTLLAK